jgi:hypothetical protein
MHRSTDLGIHYGPYGAIGFVPRIEARKSVDFFAALRWFLKLFA